MFLNNEQINNEIKDEIKRYLETNENEDTITQKLWDTAKVVLSALSSQKPAVPCVSPLQSVGILFVSIFVKHDFLVII